MKRVLVVGMVLALMVSSAMGSGFVITEENDFFLKKDNNYTQGLEMYFVDSEKNEKGELEKSSWGWRSRMYTPEDITIATNQPNDRPWAGVTTVFHEETKKKNGEYVMTGYEFGILGPEASAEWMQTTIHKWIGSRTPMGWSNQVPNEISVQYYRTYYKPLKSLGTPGKWMLDLEMPYGYVCGTTYDNFFSGLSIRAGWNIPPAHYSGSIEPKAVLSKPFAYLLFDGNGKYVLHNATFGHSFFTSYKDSEWDREIIPVVGEMHYGASVGYNNFAVTYLNELRTEEFEGQPEQFKCGMLRLEFTVLF